MGTIPLDKGREYLTSSGRIMTREGHAAIMSEVSNIKAGLIDAEKPIRIEERVRKLELSLLILVSFVLIFFVLSRTG